MTSSTTFDWHSAANTESASEAFYCFILLTVNYFLYFLFVFSTSPRVNLDHKVLTERLAIQGTWYNLIFLSGFYCMVIALTHFGLYFLYWHKAGLCAGPGVLEIWSSSSGFFPCLCQFAIFMDWHERCCTKLDRSAQQRVCGWTAMLVSFLRWTCACTSANVNQV